MKGYFNVVLKGDGSFQRSVAGLIGKDISVQCSVAGLIGEGLLRRCVVPA